MKAKKREADLKACFYFLVSPDRLEEDLLIGYDNARHIRSSFPAVEAYISFSISRAVIHQ